MLWRGFIDRLAGGELPGAAAMNLAVHRARTLPLKRRYRQQGCRRVCPELCQVIRVGIGLNAGGHGAERGQVANLISVPMLCDDLAGWTDLIHRNEVIA